MRKLLVLLLLALSALWLYASWYWYTCTIKWFCSTTEVAMTWDDTSAEVAIPIQTTESLPQEVVEETPISTDETVIVEPKTEVKVEPQPIEDTPVETQVVAETEEKKECETLIVTSIRLWSENDAGDVKDLEDFLNAFEGESLEVNWIYEQADFDAVKRLQLKYASEILTPWGVKNPTGYVYKTTTKKINDIYCGK